MKSPIEEFCLAVELQLTRANRREMVVLLGELREHLEDKQGALMARGMEETQAAREAVAAMGDPAEIGRALNAQLSHLWLYWKRFMMVLCAVALVGICFALREWWITEQLIREGAILP